MSKKIFVLFILFILFTNIPTSLADYGTSHIMTGNFSTKNSDVTFIKVNKDPSVRSYGYSTFVDEAFQKWDQNSSKIMFSLTSDEACSSCVKVYVGSNVLPPGYFAITDYWSRTSLGGWKEVSAEAIAYYGINFDRARIRLDDAHLDAAGATADSNRMNLGHEFGHTLSLLHFDNPPSHSGNHWMKVGLYQLSSPTSVDIDHLQNKWGK